MQEARLDKPSAFRSFLLMITADLSAKFPPALISRYHVKIRSD
jgi:hypothetical protein